jgi:hypothetical protein
MNDLELIADHVRRALAGEPPPAPLGEEFGACLGAMRRLLQAEETSSKDAALNVVALIALKGLNERYRAAAVCARAAAESRLQ